ncbi:MAG TPA: amylo-alpha-1,6-glucosidase, partial [Spirochaetota bacterium]|nr:amylo-alpha-1,6-glucosidase [Spirochaetota bacterium]
MSSYFTVSDFKNEFDGLWSYGFHVFKGFFTEEQTGRQKIDNKLNFPIGIRINFNKRASVACYLLKNGDGFIIEILKKRFLLNFNKRIPYFLNIGRDFEIIEKNIKQLTLKFIKSDREGYEVDELFLSISPAGNCSFENVEKKDDGILISLKYKDKDESNPALYFCYAPNYENMRKIRDRNITKLDRLKKQHVKNSYLPIKYLTLQTEDATFNRAFVWSMISGGSFVMQKAGSIGIWAGFPWFDNNWGRDTFISLPGISLVSGRYEEAWQIIESFIKRQDVNPKSKNYGKIPNVIFNETNILYNTADAAPLLIRETYEYYLYTGDYNSIMSVLNSLILAVDNVYISQKDKNNLIV